MADEIIYIDDCMRCKGTIPQEFARFSNHCEPCLKLVSEKLQWAQRERDRVMDEASSFARGEDLK